MNTIWILQVVAVTLAAGFGLGFAIRFSLASRGQERFTRVAPQLERSAAETGVPVLVAGMRRAPSA